MNQYVRPRRKVLDGKGHVWEELLAQRGWNELTWDDQNSRVVAYYTDGTIDVYFDAINYTSRGIFPDEVYEVAEKDKTQDSQKE